MDEKQMKEVLRRINANLRVTKVVATRSVKGKHGDYFAGFAAGYDSIQDEPAGMGKDLDLIVDETTVAQHGLSLKEAKIAYYLVAMNADIAAHEAALASGGISPQTCTDSVKAIRNNFGKLIRNALNGSDIGSTGVPNE